MWSESLANAYSEVARCQMRKLLIVAPSGGPSVVYHTMLGSSVLARAIEMLLRTSRTLDDRVEMFHTGAENLILVHVIYVHISSQDVVSI